MLKFNLQLKICLKKANHFLACYARKFVFLVEVWKDVHLPTESSSSAAAASSSSSSQVKKPKKRVEEILHPGKLKKMVEVSLQKLSRDECYPETVRSQFLQFIIKSIEDIFPLFDNVSESILKFNGKSEKFYLDFILLSLRSMFFLNFQMNVSCYLVLRLLIMC